MNPSTSRFTLDLQESQSQVSVPALLGDTGRVWLISLSDGGLPYSFEKGTTVLLEIKRPLEGYFESYCDIDLIQNRIIYDFSKDDVTVETALVTGIHECQITLFDENGISLGTAAFTMVVHGRPANVEIVFSDEATAKLKAIEAQENTRQTNENQRIANEELRQAAYEAYIKSVPRVVDITLLASAWVGDEDPYSQVVEIEGITENTKVDLQASAELLAIFHDKDIAFVAENEDGVVTIYAIGDKPTKDYTIQAALKEVIV